MNKWLKNTLSRFWPGHCCLCGSTGSGSKVLCQPCLNEIVSQQPVCKRCALPVSNNGELICGHCQTSPPQFQSVYSLAPYQQPLDRLVLQFKFQQKLALGHHLGQLMAKDIEQRQLPLPDVLLPVPLHRQRLRQRGYNQALELARPIAKHFNLPVDVKRCVRTKQTAEQMSLPAKKRLSNLKGAFKIDGSFYNKRVAIIDDVMTTGSTVNELAKQLRKAGAEHVDVWVCARAVL